jgi:hypothetical protein
MAQYTTQDTQGLSIQTTNVWDLSAISSLPDKISPEMKELLIRLYQNINVISLAVNLKESAYYNQQEFLTGQLFFPSTNTYQDQDPNILYRQSFRMVVNFGALPNNTTKNVAHNIQIQPEYIITKIYGASTQPSPYSAIPLPYVSLTAGDSVQIEIDETDIYITTQMDYTAYINTIVVIEYLKS